MSNAGIQVDGESIRAHTGNRVIVPLEIAKMQLRDAIQANFTRSGIGTCVLANTPWH